MIDIHSHVLPGLDDGSPSLEESLKMLRVAAETGTTDLVATPHANLQFRFDPDAVAQKLAELAEAFGNAVRLHCGCDFHFYYDNIQDALAHPEKFTINHKKYLLVEFSDLLIAKSTDDVFTRLLEAGIVPIITHPERNYLLHRRLDQIRSWVERGCLVQVTAQSLLGRFGSGARDVSRELLKRGLVHFVASDAHDSRDRAPRLDLAYRDVAKRFGGALAERLFVANPGAALTGDPLPPGPPAEPPAPRKWYQLR
jgi:protein-tyrosine phosphatase